MLPLVSLVLLLGATLYAQDSPAAKNVLVLYSFSDRDLFQPLDSLKAAVRSRVAFPVHFYAEYMDSQRFEDPAYEKSLSSTLHYAYREQQLDLVIVAAYPALRFAIAHRHEIFPNVPIVFHDVHEGRLASWVLPPGVTGVTVAVDIQGSLALAFRLHPETKNVALVTGTTEFERYWLANFRRAFNNYENQAKLIELVGLRANELFQRVSALPPHTVAFVQRSPQSSSPQGLGTFDGTYAAMAIIGEHLPTYCIFSAICLNHGGIGGSYLDDQMQMQKLAEAAGRILSGDKPENIPVWHDTSSHVEVDWRQLTRWRISESALPLGSIVLNRQPSRWEQHNKLIVGGVALILLQGVWLAVLLWQRARKRRSESDLHDSENRFRIMADTAPALIWMSDPAGRITYLNKRGLEYTGAGPEALMGEVWTSYIHPADLPGVLALNARAYQQRQGFSKEYRLRRHDGVYRWMFDVGAPRLNSDLSLAGFIGSAVDISDQKAAQEALERLGSRLIEAQEAERQHIARELHDDICQRLTVLALEIEQSMKDSDGARLHMAQMRRVWEHCSEITGDVQALSHELHSSMLDHLGIIAAIKGFCDEYSEQQGVVIKFMHANVSHSLPRNVSLCLFRVAQEAVRNAVKHSGVSLFSVRLRRTSNAIELEVCDAGVGLDLDKAKKTGGLGLISMEERVHLVKGTFAIDSRVNGGTKIRVTVPLDANGTVTNSATERVAEGRAA